MYISPSKDYSTWKSYDTDTRMDTNGKVAHFASAGFDGARMGRDIVDLVNPVSEFMPLIQLGKDSSNSALAGLVAVFLGIPMFLEGVFMTAAKCIMLPLYLLKDFTDMIAHLAVGTVQAIMGKKEGQVVDKSMTADGAPFDMWTPATIEPFEDSGRTAPSYYAPDPPAAPVAPSTAPQNALAAPTGASVRSL